MICRHRCYTSGMPLVPQPGDRFRVGPRELVVFAVEDWEARDGRSVFAVRTMAGARWALTLDRAPRDDVRWLGAPLPADPAAPPG